MATEKLSSRQKMIGMMYLVLTAMLALQVSSSVLDRFILLNSSMEKNINIQTQHNYEHIEYIKKNVQGMGNRKQDKQVLDQLIDIHTDTLNLIKYISTIKKQLITMEGGINEKTNFPNRLASDSSVTQLMLNNGEADTLKTKLDQYVSKISKVTKKKYPIIAFDAKDHDLFRDNPNQAHKNFAILNFDHTPLGAALATLSQFIAEVVNAETDVIKILGTKIGASNLKFDTVKLLANTKSNIVAAGAIYEADLILAASSSSFEPKMLVNGKPINVENGIGKVYFKTSPGEYDQNGLAKKSFKASVQLQKMGGEMSTITADIPYIVAKPVIKIKSAAIQSLYHNCGNALEVQVPALGLDYKPSFSIDNGSIIPGNKTGFITIIPKGKEVKLKVYNDKNLIGIETFIVRDIPLPEVFVTTNNKPINLKEGIPVPGPRSLEVNITHNKHFQSFLPKDARYQVAEWVVTLARGSTPINRVEVKGNRANLRAITAQAKSGDRLVIEVRKITRQNFKNELEVVHYKPVFNISLN